MNLSEKIRSLRKEKGLSQEKLGEMIGTHLTQVNRFEKGHAQPSIDIVKKIMEIFDVSADYLLDDEADSPEVHVEDKSLAAKIRLIDNLEEKDKEALIQVIDAMLTKQKMKELLEMQGGEGR
ncbi:MAG: helix-turn-helix transcriptional regulator [bacterium]|nr:helix-turn-helix transcriptional regulator [bacterium]